MEKLTQRQQQVLDLIRRHIDETGYPPTRADIARELGFKSANAAEEHLKALARKGAIEIIPGASRGIRLPESAGIPIVGRVAAGILRPDAGEVLLDGRAVDFRDPADALAAGVAMVHQELAFCPDLSVAENLVLGRWPRRGP